MTAMLVQPLHDGPPAVVVVPAAVSVAVRRLRALATDGVVRGLRHGQAVAAGLVYVHGMTVAAFATDPSTRGGALTGEDATLIAAAIDDAVASDLPVVGLWHSSGARIDQGVIALDGMGRMFAAMTRASGRVPHLSVMLGTSAGGAAYGAALSDVVVTAPAGNMFVTGPGVVAEVTGDRVSVEELGGPDVHARRSGVVHVAMPDETAALACVRDLLDLLTVVERPAPAVGEDPRFATALPERVRWGYDVRPIVELLLDETASRIEVQREWAPNMVTTLGRIGGRSVGVLANNPSQLAGCIDARAADKAARFVQMCDALGIALVVLVDVPGYLPGVDQEHDAVLRRGAKILHAFADATVPRVTLHTRKAYGGAYIAMNSRSLGATAVLAWPTAQIAVMGAEAAAQVRHRKELEAAAPSERAELLRRFVAEDASADGLQQAVAAGLVDRVIDPRRTVLEISAALRAAPRARGRHRNIPL